jgi:hypothetical protein
MSAQANGLGGGARHTTPSPNGAKYRRAMPAYCAPVGLSIAFATDNPGRRYACPGLTYCRRFAAEDTSPPYCRRFAAEDECQTHCRRFAAED